MTEQKKRIFESANYIRANNPIKGKVDTAVVSYHNPSFLREFKSVKKLPYKSIPPAFEGITDKNEGEFIFASLSKKNLYFLNGHFCFYKGYKMRDAAHPIYVLKELGVKNIIVIDEVGHLNPRFQTGGVALIYDHINFMGDNPLIGENDNSLGPRFPDMSNPYDGKLYSQIEKLFVEKKFKFFPSVYIGVTGPETETEAECRFYREIGSDILGYSLVPENLAAIHSGLNCIAFGMISRELVADRLVEISDQDKTKNRQKAEKSFAPLIKDIISLI
jgi:purine-nucleoside phosphorylase